MSTEIHVEDLNDRLRFDVKLQVALRNTAIKTSQFYEDKKKFQNYVSERESKLRSLLNIEGDFIILENNVKIYP